MRLASEVYVSHAQDCESSMGGGVVGGVPPDHTPNYEHYSRACANCGELS